MAFECVQKLRKEWKRCQDILEYSYHECVVKVTNKIRDKRKGQNNFDGEMEMNYKIFGKEISLVNSLKSYHNNIYSQ